jgi:hypothetical protein
MSAYPKMLHTEQAMRDGLRIEDAGIHVEAPVAAAPTPILTQGLKQV